MTAIDIRIYERTDGKFQVYLNGRSTPILETVPGNTRPARFASWPTAEQAEQGARQMFGCAVNVVEIGYVPRPAR